MTSEAFENRETWQATVLDLLDEAPQGFVALGEATQVYVVRSGSDPLDFYYIIVFETEAGRFKVCAKCKGFQHRNVCQHVSRVP